MAKWQPDPDDTMLCSGCSTIVKGVTAARHFARHRRTCEGNIELRSGWAVRLIGEPVLSGSVPGPVGEQPVGTALAPVSDRDGRGAVELLGHALAGSGEDRADKALAVGADLHPAIDGLPEQPHAGAASDPLQQQDVLRFDHAASVASTGAGVEAGRAFARANGRLVLADSCGRSNAPLVEQWICPSCEYEHRCDVSTCAQCGHELACSVEDDPVLGLLTVCRLIQQPHFLDAQ